MRNRLKRLGFKNTAHQEELLKIPYNFAVEHDEDKQLTTLTLYGIVDSADWWDDSISATAVDKALKSANGNDLKIRINSPGGSAFEGVAIYNRIMDYKKEHNAKVTTYIDGWACSAASLLPLTGDKDSRIIGVGAMVMIHEASTFTWGTKVDLRKDADLLEKLEEGIIDIYQTKLNKTRDEIRDLVNEETWFTADEAIDIGFATSKAEVEEESTEEDTNTEYENIMNKIENIHNEIEKLKGKKEPIEPDESQEPENNKSRAFLFY